MNHSSTARTSRRAFTLVELLVVIGIMAVLASMVTLAMVPLMRGQSLSSAVRVVQAMVYRARTTAIMQRTEVAVIFYVSDGSMHIVADPSVSLDDRVARPEFLPAAVRFADDLPVTHVGGAYPACDRLVFTSSGSLSPADQPGGMGGLGNWLIRLTDQQGDNVKVAEILFASGLASVYDE